MLVTLGDGLGVVMGGGNGGSCGISAGAFFGAVPLFPGCVATLVFLFVDTC